MIEIIMFFSLFLFLFSFVGVGMCGLFDLKAQHLFAYLFLFSAFFMIFMILVVR